MISKKLVSRALSIALATGACVTTFVASSTTPTQGASSGVAIRMKEAKANPPSNGGGEGDDWKKKFCALIGAGPTFLEEAPRECGEKNLGPLNPKATICTDSNKNDLGAEGFRKCEKCVGLPPEEKCGKELTIRGKLKADISLKIGSVGVVCKAGAEYSSTAKASVLYTNSKWQPLPTGVGDDPAINYYSEIVKSSAMSEALVKIEGGCEVVGRGANMEVEAYCKIDQFANFANVSPRAAATCGGKPDAAVLDASVVVEEDASSPTPDAAPPPPPADAGTPKLDAAVVVKADAQVAK